jgi:hypothetical protein
LTNPGKYDIIYTERGKENRHNQERKIIMMTMTKIQNTARKTAIGMSKTVLLPYLKDLFGEQAEITYKETSKGIPTEVWVWSPAHHSGMWFYFDKTTRKISSVF